MNWLDWLAIIFGFYVLLQSTYYLFVFSRLAFYKEPQRESFDGPVSVVICARNEADNLLEHLPAYFEQDHPNYEVVVVNDCSWDNTEDVLRAFELKYTNFKAVHLQENPRFSGGKKFAVTMGIKAAQYEHLVFSDADCRPESNSWLRNITAGFDGGKSIVLGYGAFFPSPGFLNKLIRFDAFLVGFQYLAFALSGMPYMGVGRNLAYKKSLFFDNKGFASHQAVASGDDDLFINEVISKQNFSVVLKDARTLSAAKQSVGGWWNQKRRHISTGKFYRPGHRFVLGSLYFSALIFWVLLFVLLAFGYRPEWVLGAYGFRLLLQIITFRRSMARLGELDLFWIFPVLELCLFIIYPILAVSNIFVKKNTWKN